MPQKTTDQQAERTAVYWLLDEDEQLLYVGVATDPRVRFKQHQREKPWWPQVAAREIEWFDTRAEALSAEVFAIREDLPIHNETGAQWPHHQLGEAPARPVSVTHFAMTPQQYMDEVTKTREPIVITRHRAPLVVIVPYFDERPT